MKCLWISVLFLAIKNSSRAVFLLEISPKKGIEMTFTYSDKTGMVSDMIKWVPGPFFLARRRAVVDIIDYYKAKYAAGKEPSVLEFGFGAGQLTYEFFVKGFNCKGIEMSADSCNKAQTIFAKEIKESGRLDFSTDAEVTGSYDIVAAFEVLEHIADDSGTILKWREHIKEGGHFFMSVPCHASKFGYMDSNAGHLRRYEKRDLIKLLESCGFEVEKFYCTGFPFLTLIYPLINRTLWKKKATRADIKEMSESEKTINSGVDRDVEYKYKNFTLFMNNVLHLLCKFQRLFYGRDWGVHYVVLAKRVE